MCHPVLTRFFTVLSLVAAGTIAVGCLPSEQTTKENAAARAAVIGTWEYRVDGAAPLDEGTFQITTKDGQLRGVLRDRRLGRLQTRVDVNDSRLELSFDDLRISGYVEDGQLTGFLRRRKWDVSTRRRSQRRSQFRSASFSARRVQSAAAADTPSILKCRSLLRETDGCN